MIFQTLSEDSQERKSKYIEVRVKIPREILEKAIRDAFKAP